MPDWSKSMQQTFEYYEVDPATWKDKKVIDCVKSSTITRDSDSETLGSATFEVTGDIDECYVRAYLVTIQNGVRERFALGTHLVQTPSFSFDGKCESSSIDAYTPLLELKENPPPLGYYIPKQSNILKQAETLMKEHTRGPVIGTSNNETLYDDFIANSSDTWLSFVTDLVANAKYEITLDEYGQSMFSPIQELAALQPVYTYADDKDSILYPDVTMNQDIYGIPNVIEVVYSKNNLYYYSRVVNDDPNSPLSTVNRGREIISRVTDPDITGVPSQEIVDEYAVRLLRNTSTVEYTVSYTHAYCGTKVGDCVRLNYERAGLKDVKAKIISQTIKCEPGCPVSEKAIYTTKLWR